MNSKSERPRAPRRVCRFTTLVPLGLAAMALFALYFAPQPHERAPPVRAVYDDDVVPEGSPTSSLEEAPAPVVGAPAVPRKPDVPAPVVRAQPSPAPPPMTVVRKPNSQKAKRQAAAAAPPPADETTSSSVTLVVAPPPVVAPPSAATPLYSTPLCTGESHRRPATGKDYTLGKCDFSKCRGDTTPPTFVIISHRNRFANLGRFLSSLTFATEEGEPGVPPGTRDCVCALLVDSGSEPVPDEGVPAARCLPPWNARLPIAGTIAGNDYMRDKVQAGAHAMLDVVPLLPAGGAPPPDGCWAGVNASAAAGPSVSRKGCYFTGGAKQGTKTAPTGCRFPCVDPAGASVDAHLLWLLSQYAGSSMLYREFGGADADGFSRGRLLTKGVDAAVKLVKPEANARLYFADADIVLRPGFFERVLRFFRVGPKRVYMPVMWAQCYATGAGEWPRPVGGQLMAKKLKTSGGWFMPASYGMTVIHAADFKNAGGYGPWVRDKGWGGEDVYLHRRLKSMGLRVIHTNEPFMVHPEHPHVRSWTRRWVGGGVGVWGRGAAVQRRSYPPHSIHPPYSGTKDGIHTADGKLICDACRCPGK